MSNNLKLKVLHQFKQRIPRQEEVIFSAHDQQLEFKGSPPVSTENKVISISFNREYHDMNK